MKISKSKEFYFALSSSDTTCELFLPPPKYLLPCHPPKKFPPIPKIYCYLLKFLCHPYPLKIVATYPKRILSLYPQIIVITPPSKNILLPNNSLFDTLLFQKKKLCPSLKTFCHPTLKHYLSFTHKVLLPQKLLRIFASSIF